MGLDFSKLENVKKAAHGKSTARCPACAAASGDEKGNHLVIYADGKYGCVANPDDKSHRKEIFALAGERVGAGSPTKISVETFQIKDSYVVMDLGRFSRFSTALRKKTSEPPEPLPSTNSSSPEPAVAAEVVPEKNPSPPPVAPSPRVGCPSLPKLTPLVDGERLVESGEAVPDPESSFVSSYNHPTDDEIAAFLALS